MSSVFLDAILILTEQAAATAVKVFHGVGFEQVRSLHEDLEVLERSMTKELRDPAAA